MNQVSAVLESMNPISLPEIGEAKLLSRIDTKFIAPSTLIAPLLDKMKEDYKVLEIDGLRLMGYYTCYFDTDDAEMFYEHQRGKKTRQKVRIRRYEDGDRLAFLEIKDKNNRGKTKKYRLELQDETIDEICREFLADSSNYSFDRLMPRIENHFNRITLVRNNLSERVTIDSGLRFHNLQTLNDAEMSDIAIIEWKHSALSEYSPLKGFIRSLRIKESGFSKYCIGMASTDSSLRANRIKEKLRKINRISWKK